MLHKWYSVCVFLLIVLGLPHGAVALQCSCRGDCADDTCEGDVCFAQAVLNTDDGSILRRWRCLPGHSSACNTTSNRMAMLCCSHADFCSDHLDPANLLTVENATVVTTQIPTTATPATAVEPTQDTPLGCYRRSSSRPKPTVCALKSTCYTTTRRHSNGSIKLYKQGCSRPNSNCTPIDRNRKWKMCCNTSLCNAFIPGISPEVPNIAPTDSNVRNNLTANTPTLVSIPPEVTTATHPPPPTTTIGDPLAPNIGANTIPPPSTLTPPPSTNGVTSPSTLRPHTTTSTTQTTSSTTPPRTHPGTGVQTLLSNTDAPTMGFVVCFCSDCSGSGFCGSQVGCATVYTGDNSTRMCLTDLSMCQSVENGPRVECCSEQYCNSPPEIDSVEDLPTSSPDTVTTPGVSMTTESPATLGSNTTSTTATTNHSATDAGTVTPDVNTGTSDSLAATHPQSSTTPSEDGGTNSDYIYYILTGVVCAVCAVCMILVVVACVYICRQYRVHNLTSTLCTRRTPAKASGSSERRPSEAV